MLDIPEKIYKGFDLYINCIFEQWLSDIWYSDEYEEFSEGKEEGIGLFTDFVRKLETDFYDAMRELLKDYIVQ